MGSWSLFHASILCREDDPESVYRNAGSIFYMLEMISKPATETRGGAAKQNRRDD
jgi:hypothetical protein